MNQILPIPHIHIALFFNQEKARLDVEKISGEGYTMDEEGNISLLQRIETGSHGLIEFEIRNPPGALKILRFEGLRISADKSKLPTSTIWRDTNGARIDATPFKVSSNDMATALQLSTWPFFEEIDPLDAVWYFTVGALTDGDDAALWLDPRIHNKGDECQLAEP